MKITKNDIKEIIREELVGLQEEEIQMSAEIKGVFDKLIKKIDSLDLSIDYLAAAINQDDPYSVHVSQKMGGRYVKPRTVKEPQEKAAGE